MRKSTIVCCLLLLTVAWGQKAFAQDAPKPAESAKAPEPPGHFYHLEFVVQETGSDGKPINSRTYSGTVSTGRTDRGFSMRTGSRIPVITSASSGENKNTQYQYIDVGVNIDAREAQEQGDKLALSLVADISSLAGSTGPVEGAGPVIRQNRWQAAALVPIAKPTVVFTSDVLDNRGGMQLVVTVTPVK